MRIALALAVFVVIVPVAVGKVPPPPTETTVVQTGRAPCGLAAWRGELWVGVYESGMLLRLDREGRIRQRIRVGRFACRVAVDDRTVWVTRDNAGTLVRIDRRTGRRQSVRVPSPYGVVRAAGGIWVTGFETGTVSRIDPRTARVTRVYRTGGHPTGITACAGSVWVGHGRDATWLNAIDTRTRRMRRVDVVVPSPRAPQCVRGQLWVTTPEALLRVAPGSGELLAQIPLGETLADVAAPTGAANRSTLWVTDKQHSLVHRIDTGTGRVIDSIPAGPGAFALAALGDSMWITSFAGADVRRYQP